MTKISSLFIIVFLVFSFTGCQTNHESSISKNGETSSSVSASDESSELLSNSSIQDSSSNNIVDNENTLIKTTVSIPTMNLDNELEGTYTNIFINLPKEWVVEENSQVITENSNKVGEFSPILFSSQDNIEKKALSYFLTDEDVLFRKEYLLSNGYQIELFITKARGFKDKFINTYVVSNDEWIFTIDLYGMNSDEENSTFSNIIKSINVEHD